MKEKLLIVFVSLMCMPLVASAQSINVTNEALSRTGGLSASAGAAVSTSDGSASSEITTVIKGGNGSSTVDIQITTEKNGVVQTETQHQDFAPGTPVVIHVATSSARSGIVSTSSNVQKRVHAAIKNVIRAVATATVATSSSTTPERRMSWWFRGWFFSDEPATSTATGTSPSRKVGFLGLQNLFKSIFGLFIGF